MTRNSFLKALFALAFVFATSFGQTSRAEEAGNANQEEEPSLIAPDRNTVNVGANQGGKAQNWGKIINYAAAGALFRACIKADPNRWDLCEMGRQALQQAQQLQDASAASYNSGWESSSGGGGGAPPTGTITPGGANGGGGAGEGASGYIDEGLAAMAESGYKLGPNGLTTPDGTTRTAKDYSSFSAMAAAGLSPEAISEAQKILASVNADASKAGYNTASMAMSESPGGGAGGMGDYGAGDYSQSSGSIRNPFAGRDKATVNGKTVLFGGEPIGVKEQNIFGIVHQAYQKKRVGNQFIEAEAAGVRLPSSISKPARPAGKR